MGFLVLLKIASTGYFEILNLDEKSLRGVYVLMNWKESCLFALLIASGYFF